MLRDLVIGEKGTTGPNYSLNLSAGGRARRGLRPHCRPPQVTLSVRQVEKL